MGRNMQKSANTGGGVSFHGKVSKRRARLTLSPAAFGPRREGFRSASGPRDGFSSQLMLCWVDQIMIYTIHCLEHVSRVRVGEVTSTTNRAGSCSILP
jgi:hypothetical protein